MSGTGMAHLSCTFVCTVAAIVSARIGNPYPALIFGMMGGALMGSFVMCVMAGEYDG